MQVVDISAWQTERREGYPQKEVDWPGIINAGIGGVIVKLGENYALDEMFVENVNKAVETGLKFGLFFYSNAETVKEAQEEADWVYKQINTYLDGKCPELGVWFDMEDDAILSSGADITALCKAFVDRLHELGIDYAGVYSSYNWLMNYIDVSSLGDTPIWVAQYNSHNDFTDENPDANVKIWQFTDHYSDDLPYDGDEYYD